MTLTPEQKVVPDRTNEINANLAEGLKNDAGIQKALQSGDNATFRARYGYNTADQNKKTLLDNFFNANKAKTTDFNSSVGREDEIMKNLNEGYKNSPELFQNESSFKSAYGYDTADQNKKTLLDNFYNKNNGKGTINPAHNMDTSEDNVINLNKEINTLFKKQNNTTTPSSPTNANYGITTGTGKTPATPTVESNTADAIKQSQQAINDERNGIKRVQDATNNQLKTGEDTANSYIAGEQKYATDITSLNQQRISDIKTNTAEWNAEQERQTKQTIDTLQPLADLEKAKFQAGLNALQVKNETIEIETAISNDVNNRQMAMAYASMGMQFTPSAINATAQLVGSQLRGMATLKSNNAYNYANLAKDMGKIEFDHQTTINSIISQNNESIINKREKSSKEITDIQSNIILTEKEKTDKINAIKDEYAKFRVDTESSLFNQVRTSNNNIQGQIDRMQGKLDIDRTNSRTQIASLVRNGQWDKMSEIEKHKLAVRSGLTTGEIEGEKSTSVYSAVDAGIKAILGTGFVVTPQSSKRVYDKAMAYVARGYSLTTAIQMGINEELPNLSEYQSSQAYSASKRSLDLEGDRANINSINASTNKTIQDANFDRNTETARKDILEAKASADKSSAKNPWSLAGSGTNAEGQVLMYNKDSGNVEWKTPEVNKTDAEWRNATQEELLDAQPGQIIMSRLPKGQAAGNGGKQCGEYANDLSGTHIGVETIEDRKKVFTEGTPEVGGQVFFDKGGDSQYGHVAVVKTVNPDGTITITESNADGRGAIGERVVPANSAYGYFNNTKMRDKAKEAGVSSLDDLKKTSTINVKKEKEAKNATERVLNEFAIPANITNAKEINTELNSIIANTSGTENDKKLAANKYLVDAGLIPEPFKKNSEGKLLKGAVEDFVSSKWVSQGGNSTEAVSLLRKEGIKDGGANYDSVPEGGIYYIRMDDGSYEIRRREISEFFGLEDVSTDDVITTIPK